MPFFARRRIRQMVNEIRHLIDADKTKELLARLESSKAEQVLPAEIELAILWGLAQLGELEVEPPWVGGSQNPDAFSEHLLKGLPMLIEIAGVADARLSGDREMSRVAGRISEAANALKKGSGNHLFFTFHEESGYEEGLYVRRRRIDPEFKLTDDAKVELGQWLRSDLKDGERFRLLLGRTGVDISWKARRTGFRNYFSSMPPEAHALEGNPLWDVLYKKRDQLKHDNSETIRCIILGDAGSTLLRNLNHFDPLGRTVNGSQIINHFLKRYPDDVHVVCVFSPSRSSTSVYGQRGPLKWMVTTFSSPTFQHSLNGFEDLAATLPRPNFEGYQARVLQQQNSFAIDAPAWYLPYRIEIGKNKMTIRVSSRAVLDLMAGRITQKEFYASIGAGEESRFPNFFKQQLDQGNLISAVLFESGGIDEDDDLLVFEFLPDPAMLPIYKEIEKGSS